MRNTDRASAEGLRAAGLREALRLAEERARDYDDLATAYNLLADAVRAALRDTGPREDWHCCDERSCHHYIWRQSSTPRTEYPPGNVTDAYDDWWDTPRTETTVAERDRRADAGAEARFLSGDERRAYIAGFHDGALSTPRTETSPELAARGDPERATWTCTVTGPYMGENPPGSDLPMREAVREAYERVTGHSETDLWSGWNGHTRPPTPRTETSRELTPVLPSGRLRGWKRAE